MQASEQQTESSAINFEAEIEQIKKTVGNSAPNPQINSTASKEVVSDAGTGQALEKRGRGRPKGSKNKINVSSGAVVSSQSSSGGMSADGESVGQGMQKVTPAMAQGFIACISGMFIVMRLEPISDDEKKGFIEVWSNVELPVSSDNKFMKYLPIISAGIFTIGLLMPRLAKLKEKRSQKEPAIERPETPQISKENNTGAPKTVEQLPPLTADISMNAGAGVTSV